VHRLLAAAIDLESLPSGMSNKIRMSRLCDKMNMRHRNARFASRASSDYHTYCIVYLFFKNRALEGKDEEEGIITGILGKGFSVILPKYGLEGFIQFSPEDTLLNK
jgi:exosome complex exonuclease DIS3/RRP44